MRFGIWPWPARSREEIREITAHRGRAGWDGACFADHFVPDGSGPARLDGDTLECWPVIAAALQWSRGSGSPLWSPA